MVEARMRCVLVVGVGDGKSIVKGKSLLGIFGSRNVEFQLLIEKQWEHDALWLISTIIQGSRPWSPSPISD